MGAFPTPPRSCAEEGRVCPAHDHTRPAASHKGKRTSTSRDLCVTETSTRTDRFEDGWRKSRTDDDFTISFSQKLLPSNKFCTNFGPKTMMSSYHSLFAMSAATTLLSATSSNAETLNSWMSARHLSQAFIAGYEPQTVVTDHVRDRSVLMFQGFI